MLSPWAQIALIIAGYVIIWYIIGIIIKDNSKVDIAWAIIFVAVTLYSYLMFSDDYLDGRQITSLVCVTLWGLRLAIYILIRGCGHG